MTKPQLEEQNKLLWNTLETANKYLAKAVADGLMENCAIPASVIHKRTKNILNKTKNTLNS